MATAADRPKGSPGGVATGARGRADGAATIASPELTAERTRLRAIIEQLPAAVLIVDARTSLVAVANAEAQRIAGARVAVGAPADAHAVVGFHPGGGRFDADEWPLARALRGERVRSEIVEVHNDDGTVQTMEITASPISDDHGEILDAVVTFHDVSDRYERERAERDFVTNAAHELRTPLASITSAIEVLQAGAKEHPEQRELFLAHIEAAVGRLTRLTHALLILARAQTGVEPPKTEVISLEPVVRAAAEALAPAEGVELQIRIARPLAVLGNRALLEQALAAVANNAAHYTQSGHIAFTAERTGKDVTIMIADSGIGFPRELRERVLERFGRGERASADGFGLGLSIARQSLEALGGSLSLDSMPGEGTTVRITVPGATLVST